MSHLASISRCAGFCVLGATAWLFAAPALAGHSSDCGGGVSCSWDDTSNNDNSAMDFDPGPDPAVLAQQQRVSEARQKSNQVNDQGVAAFSSGDYARAQALFEQAIAIAQQEGLDPGRTLLTNLEETRRVLQNKSKQAEAQATISRSLDRLSHAFDSSTTGDTVAGLDFDRGAAKPASHTQPTKGCPIVTDSRVVDTCSVERWGRNLPTVAEIEQSPAADRARKGLQAVANHDWPVALAWFQEALARDPGNKALQRSVDMAQWVISWRARTASARKPLEPVLGALDNGDMAGARAALSEIEKSRPDLVKQTQRADAFLDAHARNFVQKPDERKDLNLLSDLMLEGEYHRSLSDELFEEALLQADLGHERLSDFLLAQGIQVYLDESAKSVSASAAPQKKVSGGLDFIHN